MKYFKCFGNSDIEKDFEKLAILKKEYTSMNIWLVFYQ